MTKKGQWFLSNLPLFVGVPEVTPAEYRLDYTPHTADEEVAA